MGSAAASVDRNVMTPYCASSILPGCCPWRRWHYWLLGILSAMALVLVSASQQAVAQDAYPPFQDPYVNDYADILSASQETDIQTTLADFRAQTDIHVVVLTIHSIADYSTGDSSLESFATGLFNTWGIGDASRNDGILLLVAPGDRRVRLELGSGYSSADDRLAQAIIDDEILPFFREGDLAEGTRSGVAAIVRRFDPEQRSSLAERAAPFRGRPIDLSGLLMPAATGAGGLGIAAGMMGWRWWRFRQRQCPTCHSALERLDEQADDKYLNPGQRREESLQSVDYDVWLCPQCGYHTTLSYGSLWSRYKRCSRCRHRTLAVQSRTIVAPTYTRSGKAEITEDCQFCEHRRVYTRTLPRKQRSSSSSRSGGGGGCSSGGGASGSW